jgi:spermidine/putrescine transport system permease protein
MSSMRSSALLWKCFGLLMAAFMLSPLVLVVFFSFARNPRSTLPVGGFTVSWYRVLFENPNFWAALENSLLVTLSVGVISTVVGTLAALGLARWRAGRASAALTVLTLPIMMPPLVLALALATSYSTIGLSMGLHTVISSHLVFTQPFVILIVYAQMANFDYSVVESARDLGASPVQTFFTVTLPIIHRLIPPAPCVAITITLPGAAASSTI